MAWRSCVAVACLSSAALVLSACSSAPQQPAPAASQESTGFVAGDGSIVVLDEAARQPAPDLRGTTLDGQPFSLADHRGEVVVLNVWASWCAPCRAEAPDLAQAAREMRDSGVTFVGLDTRDSDTAAKAFVERMGVDYPSVVDRDGRLQLLFADTLPPQAIPSTLVIDPQGRVAARVLGAVNVSTLRGLVEPLVASREPAASSTASASTAASATP